MVKFRRAAAKRKVVISLRLDQIFIKRISVLFYFVLVIVLRGSRELMVLHFGFDKVVVVCFSCGERADY